MPPWDPNKPDRPGPAVGAHGRASGAWTCTILLALGVICGFAVARLLRRHEPEVMRK